MSTSQYAQRYMYSNPQMDVLMQQADVEMDTAKRMEYYQQAQDLLVEDSVVVFLFNSINSYMVKPIVGGIIASPQDTAFPGDMDPLKITVNK
jgi:oligopeptide transport system substrate-binding protein